MKTVTRLRYNCLKKGMLECFPGHQKCYFEHQKCQYIISNSENVLQVCRNGRHLNNCDMFRCEKTHKCPKSYCISHAYVCDGK